MMVDQQNMSTTWFLWAALFVVNVVFSHNRIFCFLFLFHCSYQDLLSWLLQKKSHGYWIVGLEQTSSSVPIQTVEIPFSKTTNHDPQQHHDRLPPTVLLLGKEKEGIPVSFLQVVDQCIDIPQFGMIRSLNVHASGAIAIWEFTRRQQQQQQQQQQPF
jgi:tRNA G18 (ribose-2'-O)-methylase SpoU